jgi:hypothetical protein
MSVLSRRLERFAAGFSVATFAFFLLGLYAAANHEGQILYLSAGLGSMCLFAAFFLWLANGFAWAMIPEKPAEAKKPADALWPAEEMKPLETLKPLEALKPAEEKRVAETKKPVEATKPVEAKKSANALWPAEALKPLETLPPLEELKPLEMKPAEETEPAEDPPDAKYTITGKRIY